MYNNVEDTSAVQKWIYFFKPKIDGYHASEKIDLNAGWTVFLKLNQALTSGFFMGTNSDNWYANSHGNMISFTSKGYNKDSAFARYVKIDLFAYGIDATSRIDVEMAWMMQGEAKDTGCFDPDVNPMDRNGTYLWADGTKFDENAEVILHNGGFRGLNQASPSCTCRNGVADVGCESGEEKCASCLSGIAFLLFLN